MSIKQEEGIGQWLQICTTFLSRIFIFEKRDPKRNSRERIFFLMCEYLIVAIMRKQKKVEVFKRVLALGKTGDIFSVWYTIAKSRREATR
jgi:hypothetical protein